MKRMSHFALMTGLVLSVATGIWHFAIPYIYHWQSFIPNAPRAISVSIDWINFFFSLLLTGHSLLLLRFRRDLEAGNRVAVAVYRLLIFVWVCRVAITLVHPWAYDRMMVYQVSAFGVVLLLLAMPIIARLLRQRT